MNTATRERGPVAASYPPRGMRRIEAARYVGIGTTTFDAWVADGRLPAGVKEGGVVLWDRLALDAAMDALFDAHPEDIRL